MVINLWLAWLWNALHPFSHDNLLIIIQKREVRDLNPVRRFWRPKCYRLHQPP